MAKYSVIVARIIMTHELPVAVYGPYFVRDTSEIDQNKARQDVATMKQIDIEELTTFIVPSYNTAV